jgi:hypothetical protein
MVPLVLVVAHVVPKSSGSAARNKATVTASTNASPVGDNLASPWAQSLSAYGYL